MSAPIVIDGSADVVGGSQPAGDVCLSLGDRFNPAAGQTARSLQPCTVTVVADPQVQPVAFDAVSMVRVLPATGSTSSPVVLSALVVLVVGVMAVVASRRKVSSRPPRGVKSPSDASGASALVEASVPVESGVLKRSPLPVREVSVHTVPCDGNVVEGSPTRPGLLSATGSSVSLFDWMGDEFAAMWDGDERDWCAPHGVLRRRS